MDTIELPDYTFKNWLKEVVRYGRYNNYNFGKFNVKNLYFFYVNWYDPFNTAADIIEGRLIITDNNKISQLYVTGKHNDIKILHDITDLAFPNTLSEYEVIPIVNKLPKLETVYLHANMYQDYDGNVFEILEQNKSNARRYYGIGNVSVYIY